MIDDAGILAQAQKAYRAYLVSLVDGQSVFPWDLRFAKVKSGEATARYNDLFMELARLKANSDEGGKASYQVEWEERKDRLAGTQRFPARIFFPTAASLLGYLRKAREAQSFEADLALIRHALPELDPWLMRRPERVVECHGEWEKLVRLIVWFKENPRPGIFVREIPVLEDTKFVERHKLVVRELLDAVLGLAGREDDLPSTFEDRYGLRKALPQIRLRILDKPCATARFSGIADLALPLDELPKMDFPEIRRILILENKANFGNVDAFLILPALEGTIAVFGSGFAVKSLSAAPWMKSRRILYWGDIDTQGLRILSMLRCHLPQSESILMDMSSFDAFPQFRCDAPKDSDQVPSELTEDEAILYRRLAGMEKGNRLEQERIPVAWVRDALERAMTASDH